MTREFETEPVTDKKDGVLPSFTELLPPAVQKRVMTRTQWLTFKRAHSSIEIAQRTFDAAIEKKAAEMVSKCQNALNQAREQGLNQAADRLIKNSVKTAHSAKEQQDELVRLMFAALENILGTLPAELVCAQIARTALNKQSDANSVVSVTVHPSAIACVQKQIDTWRSETSSPRIELTSNPAMATTDCDIETSYGTVRAGLQGQLNVLKHNLLQASEHVTDE